MTRKAVLAAALSSLVLALGCRSPVQPTADAAPHPRDGFLKGQLHAHTSGSGDSDTPPETAMAWYAQHGFDFVVITDHNRVTETALVPGMLVFRGVELTQNLRTCEPPPRQGDACLLHVNALFVTQSSWWVRLGEPESHKRVDLYGRAIDRALAMGGLAQLNHPNFQGGADLDVLLAAVKRGATLVEIANEASDSDNDGGPGRPSTETLWDEALVRGAHVFGTATDDAHHYDDAPARRAFGETVYTGDKGFVMVRAAPNEQAIRAAIAAGDFYASTGVMFDRIEVGPSAIALDVRPDGLGPIAIEVIANGRVASRTEGRSLRLDPRAYAPGYVRVRVTDPHGRRAWTQPVWL